VCGVLDVLPLLSDRAIIEEAFDRLGPAEFFRVLKITRSALDSWRARPTHRLKPEQKELLIGEIRKRLPEELANPTLAALKRIEESVNELKDRPPARGQPAAPRSRSQRRGEQGTGPA